MKTINVMLDEGAFMPQRAHEDDAGLDLFSPIKTCIWHGETATIDTGVHIEIPKGYVGMLKSKSGLNVKHGITGEGVIDSGYTGSIVCKLYNNSLKNFHVEVGDKIIQLVILPVETPKIVLVNKFQETERGDAGFGSTGNNLYNAGECFKH